MKVKILLAAAFSALICTQMVAQGTQRETFPEGSCSPT